MGTPSVYTFPKADPAAVSALQTTAGAGTILLNGTLAVNTNNGLFVNFDGISRVVSLTSLNDLSGVNVTINGTLNGAAVTATLAGPNDNTVSTTQLYSSVTSVSVNGAVTGLSVGTGSTGATNWKMIDEHGSVMNLGIAVIATATISYSFQVTLDDANTVVTPNVFTPITALTAATGSELGDYTGPIRFANIIINSSSGNGALTATMIQQGLTS